MAKFYLTLALLLSISAVTEKLANSAPPDPEPKKQMMAFSKDSSFFLKELGTVLIENEDGLIVKFAGPDNMRELEYKTVDLQKGDLILMLNGKSATTVKELEDGYLVIESGDDVELGIRRDKEFMIVSFPRGDEGADEHLITISTGSGDCSPEADGGAISSEKLLVLSPNEDGSSMIALLEAGLLLEEEKGEIVLKMILPGAQDLEGGKSLKEGDLLVSIQGKSVDDIKDFFELYDDLEPNTVVRIVFIRDGAEYPVTFAKPDNK